MIKDVDFWFFTRDEGGLGTGARLEVDTVGHAPRLQSILKADES